MNTISCDVCFEAFNHTTRSPEIIYNCFHTFCKECVEKLKECPSCRKKIISYNTNYFLLRLIVEDEELLKSLRSEISLYVYEHKNLVFDFNELYETKQNEIRANYHRILNKIKHLYSEFSKYRMKIKNEHIAKHQTFSDSSILRLDKDSLYVMSNFSYVINEITDDLELKVTKNSSQCNDIQMKNRLTKECNKLMDAINKHYNTSMAKLAVDKNKDIESLKQKYTDMMTFFIKNNFKQSIEDALRNMYLINQFSLEEMQVMKSKKDDIILQLKQKISDLKQFNTSL